MVSDQAGAFDWVPLVVGILSAFVGITGLVLAAYFNRRTLEQKQIEDHRREIYKKLNEFYGPCLLNLRISRELYSLLTADRAPGFSALRFFLAGNEFIGNDAELYLQINRITNRVDELITRNPGLVDKPELQRSLAIASAHFRIIDSAYNGSIRGEIDRFSGYSYTTALVQELEAEVHELQAELDCLNGKKHLGESHPAGSRFPITDPALLTSQRAGTAARS